MKIRLYGDPILRKKASPVKKVGSEEKKIFDDMAQTMYSAEGVGLAATQVGIDKQLLVVDVGTGLLKLANPRIIKAQCKKMGEEGCLSFPGISVKIKRPSKILVQALNQAGDRVKIEAEGRLARALQHEIDHLMGVVIIDRIGIRQRLMIIKKLWQLARLGRQKK